LISLTRRLEGVQALLELLLRLLLTNLLRLLLTNLLRLLLRSGSRLLSLRLNCRTLLLESGLEVLLPLCWLLGLRTLLLLRLSLLDPSIITNNKLILRVHALQLHLGGNGSKSSVSRKARDLLPHAVDRPHLGNPVIRSPIKGGLAPAGQHLLGGSVPHAARRPGTPVTSVTGLPEISVADWVGLPGAILAAQRVNVSSCPAVESAPLVQETLRTVSGDAGTQAGNLFINPGLVFNTPRYISPRAILLT